MRTEIEREALRTLTFSFCIGLQFISKFLLKVILFFSFISILVCSWYGQLHSSQNTLRIHCNTRLSGYAVMSSKCLRSCPLLSLKVSSFYPLISALRNKDGRGKLTVRAHLVLYFPLLSSQCLYFTLYSNGLATRTARRNVISWKCLYFQPSIIMVW